MELLRILDTQKKQLLKLVLVLIRILQYFILDLLPVSEEIDVLRSYELNEVLYLLVLDLDLLVIVNSFALDVVF
tara:strand:+ start:409 stop:630 length:222 start_codon:yes stop_codon:yes gene_type:complete